MFSKLGWEFIFPAPFAPLFDVIKGRFQFLQNLHKKSKSILVLKLAAVIK